MSKLPGSVPCWKVINALQRDGWVVIRHQKTSHIQLAKRDDVGSTRITISDHGTVSRRSSRGSSSRPEPTSTASSNSSEPSR